MQWRLKPALPVTKLIGAAALAALVVAFGGDDPIQWALALLAVAGLTGWALRDLIRPVRLVADPDGVTVVTGFATRRHLSWPAIERVRVDARAHRGIRSEYLEIDAGDSLHLLSQHELNADPAEVAATLARIREEATSSGTASERSI
ncbi:PH domain-containing protein [Actinoplanes sp. NPDC051494]|uniref:PH domain-containing protein n=1 Tax=Actinoplanes sp. NPDC051494 TaxID=3363907 RepID=UPI0037927264